MAVAKVLVETTASDTENGPLGVSKPIGLAMAHADRLVTIKAFPADRCDARLDMGRSHDLAHWTLGAGCDGTVKIVPYTGDLATTEETQVAALGAGTCTLNVEMLGANGTATITVK